MVNRMDYAVRYKNKTKGGFIADAKEFIDDRKPGEKAVIEGPKQWGRYVEKIRKC